LIGGWWGLVSLYFDWVVFAFYFTWFGGWLKIGGVLSWAYFVGGVGGFHFSVFWEGPGILGGGGCFRGVVCRSWEVVFSWGVFVVITESKSVSVIPVFHFSFFLHFLIDMIDGTGRGFLDSNLVSISERESRFAVDETWDMQWDYLWVSIEVIFILLFALLQIGDFWFLGEFLWLGYEYYWGGYLVGTYSWDVGVVIMKTTTFFWFWFKSKLSSLIYVHDGIF
jgi:hypothetical protein